MRSAPLESVIEAAAVKRARRDGWLAIKQGGQGNGSGWPDRLFVSPAGVHVWIEFKRLHGKLTALQKGKIADLTARGCFVYVCYSADEAAVRLAQHRPGSNFYPGAEDL